MKENFQQSFDKSFRESCRTEAIKKGAPQKIAEKYCDCTLAKFKETKSMDESAKACLAQVKSEMHP